MNCWLVKTEPNVYSIDDLQRDSKTWWTGVRNYQARNYLREMQVGDLVLVYHSNAEPPGVVGVAKVACVAEPDQTQFDKKSEYFEAKASKQAPRWFCPQVRFVKKMRKMVSLDELRENGRLADMILLKRGSRLSVIPVTREQYEEVLRMGE